MPNVTHSCPEEALCLAMDSLENSRSRSAIVTGPQDASLDSDMLSIPDTSHDTSIKPPAYATSKAGVESLTRHTAAVRAPDNIRVNAVAFGPIARPPMLEAAKQPVVQEALARLPLRRMGRPNEAAQVVAFFLTDSSSYVTGQVLGVNGGSNLIN